MDRTERRSTPRAGSTARAGRRATARAGRRAVLVAVTIGLLGAGPLTVGVGRAAAAPADDPAGPGVELWQPVPRDEVAERCGLDPDLMDEASAVLTATPFTVVRYGQLCWRSLRIGVRRLIPRRWRADDTC